MPGQSSFHEQIARSATLIAETAVVIERSRALYRRAHVVTGRALPMRGGSDAALVVSLLRDAQLCLVCISKKAVVPYAQANALLLLVARTLRLQIGPHRCDGCLENKTTFSVAKDGHR